MRCICDYKFLDRDDEYDHWDMCLLNPKNIIKRIENDLALLKKVLGQK